MSGLPAFLLVHTVTVRPYAGRTSSGDLFGDEFPLPCMAQGQRKMVRTVEGNETLATLTLYAAPGQADTVPTGSEVTWQGRTTTVLASTNQDGGNLGTPDHTEVVCE